MGWWNYSSWRGIEKVAVFFCFFVVFGSVWSLIHCWMRIGYQISTLAWCKIKLVTLVELFYTKRKRGKWLFGWGFGWVGISLPPIWSSHVSLNHCLMRIGYQITTHARYKIKLVTLAELFYTKRKMEKWLFGWVGISLPPLWSSHVSLIHCSFVELSYRKKNREKWLFGRRFGWVCISLPPSLKF